MVKRVTGGEVVSLRSGPEEDAEEGENTDGGDDKGKEAAVRDGRL